MTNCPKFTEMKKMFHGKSMTIVKVQPIAKTQTITIHVNVVDVNVTMRNKTIKKRCSRIENQGKKRVLLTGKKKNS
jgi:hypothetical protein